jgi:lysophospholipase L1-like esterase
MATTYWFGLTGIDVMAARPTGVVVALGDSLTDGFGSTVDANTRWPDFLARRLTGPDAAGRPFAVLNAGISGNQLARASTSSPSALTRLGDDALTQTGVTDLILLEGINDIASFGEDARPAAATVSPDELARPVIAAYRRIISQAHAAGVRVVGATLTPVGLTGGAEKARRIVNQWIRNSGAFDAVADFDAAVRNPASRSRLLPALGAPDGIHLNDAGAQAVAGTVPVGALGVRCG